MESDSQATAGPQTEIVAKTQFNPAAMLRFIVPIALVIPVLFLTWGISGAVYVLLFAIAEGAFYLFTERYAKLRRALFDREGMTLLPRVVGRLSTRPLHFRWDEVLEVRRPFFRIDGPIRLRLNRPRKFWTFRPRQQQNVILVPRGIWTEPQFAEAIRDYVPAERIHAGLAFDESHSLSARYWRVFALVFLLCAAVNAGCSFAIIRGESFIGTLQAALPALVIGALAITLCAVRAPAAFGLVAGLLDTFPLLSLAGIFLAFFFPGGMALFVGVLGAAAGALAGAALMVINGRKSGAWRYAGATFLLAAAGFWCAWAGFHQISAIRLGIGRLDYGNPWTPTGDAFLMTEGDYSGISDKPTTVCWYSRDLKPERRAVLPGSARALAVGQDAALLCVIGELDKQLWFVPRRSELRFIEKAPSFEEGRISPDSRRALISIWNAPRDPLAWQICDLETGKVEPVNLPLPLKDGSAITLRDDQTVLWLSGSRPLDKGNNPVNHRTSLPESGEFPHAGKPYVVWSWKVNSAGAPAQLYAAKTQWVGWGRSDKAERLHVCRISESPPARIEYVALDFTQSPPSVTTISEEDFESQPPWTSQARSFDGRFTVEGGSSGFFAPAFIVDTKTGRKFNMQSAATLTGMLSLHWSPSANEFVMEVAEAKLAGELWRWNRELEKTIEIASVVYFVDMDRQ